MTIQVGMVGKDGIVLASDTCMVELDSIYNTINGRKLFPLDSQKVIWGFAGDESAYRCGQQLEADFHNNNFYLGDIQKSLEKSGDAAFRKESERPRFKPDINRRLLVVFYGNQVEGIELWELKLQEKGSVANRITGKAVTGDKSNTARFFCHYYSEFLTIGSLLQLAAHIVLMAHERNTLLIEGLDILTVTKDGYRWIGAEEKEAIQRRSLLLHESIRKQLTEAPDVIG